MGCLWWENWNTRFLQLWVPIFNSVCLGATVLVSGIALQEGRPKRKCNRGIYKLDNQWSLKRNKGRKKKKSPTLPLDFCKVFLVWQSFFRPKDNSFWRVRCRVLTVIRPVEMVGRILIALQPLCKLKWSTFSWRFLKLGQRKENGTLNADATL